MTESKSYTLSFVVLVGSHELTLQELYQMLAREAEGHASVWEVVFLNDASDRESWLEVQSLAKHAPEHVRALNFRNNCPSFRILEHGFSEATGDVIFTMGADPACELTEISHFLTLLDEGGGYDIVSAHAPLEEPVRELSFYSRIFKNAADDPREQGYQEPGFKCFRRAVVEKLPVGSERKHMPLSLEALKSYRCREVEVVPFDVSNESPILERIDILREVADGEAETSPGTRPISPLILVADDDPVTRSLSSRILEAEGWTVQNVATAENVLRHLTAKVNVILLDIYLPGLTGLEVLPKIKKLAPSTQVVILSGSEKVTDGAEAIRAGACDYLSKPVRKESLMDAVERALEQNQALLPSAERLDRGESS